jgi:polysaccharide export outer membrane protein
MVDALGRAEPAQSNARKTPRYLLFLFFTICAVGYSSGQTSDNPPIVPPYGSGLTPQAQNPGAQTLPSDAGSSSSSSSGQSGGDLLQQQQLPAGATLRNTPTSTNNESTLYDRTGRYQPLPPPEVPVQLTSFQRLAAASTGKVLPVFGANLFGSTVPSTFAPVDRIPVTPEYVLGPGDELLIRLWGQVTLDSRFTIDRSGNVYIPQVGAVRVAGLPFAQVQEYLRSRIARNFRNFDINVNMGQLRSIQLFVVGEARHPGSYTVSSLSTLVNALFASGGPSPAGSMRRIQLKRGGATISEFDLYDLLLKGDKSKDVALLSGDVIFIAPVGPVVAVAGSVDVPAVYELKGESTVGEAIALAGGLSPLAQNKNLRIERIDEQGSRSVLDVRLDEAGLSTTLRSGDILVVDPIVNRYKDAVILRGNIANPSRYRWSPGMRIHDLIPDKDVLLTRDYWERHNRLGIPTLDATPDIRQDAPVLGIFPSQRQNVYIPTRDNDSNIYASQSPSNLATGSLSVTPLANPYSVTPLANPYADAYLMGGANPGSNGVNPQDLNAVNPYNLPPTRNASEGALFAQRPETGSQIGSSSLSTGVTQAAGNFARKNTVVLSAPDIDWAYAVIERLDKRDLTTKLLPFNLGKVVLENDESENYELQPGDVITIFSKADIRVPQVQQTKYVRLEGEFIGAGIYSVGPYETLRQLVVRAGGLSPSAYLYGSEFTRESTRVLQQQRLNEYADTLEHRTSLVEANAATSAGGPQDLAAIQAGVQEARGVVGKLRTLRSSGRIVLQLKPDSTGVESLPDLTLEDGDHFVVPSVPSSVDVYGAVYTQNSFLYDPRRRVGDYLREAGGANRTADTKRAYIVRADGSIVSRQYSSSLFSGGFDNTRMNPGDAIVLPEVVYRRSALRQLVDISTIIGQFGLGAAAVRSLLP